MITVAVCIPTYCRAGLLREAVTSCFRQTRRPDEICIEDNSPDDATEQVVKNLMLQTSAAIDYRHTHQRLGQANNFNNLIKRVTCSHFVLLHDDDLLLPNAVQDLSACWDRHPDLTAAYGKQYVMSDGGETDFTKSERLNAGYHRTAAREGLQEPGWFPGIAQQFPNDGYMVRTSAASDIQWRPALKNGCEFDFGLRLCLKFQGFYFVNRYTMKYRENSFSMSTSSGDDATLRAFWILHHTRLPEAAQEFRRARLKEIAPQAVLQAVRTGQRGVALRIYLSEFYPWSRRLTPRSILSLTELFVPRGVANFIRSRLQRRRMRKKK
jgi:GT2 family glycosyltransferase